MHEWQSSEPCTNTNNSRWLRTEWLEVNLHQNNSWSHSKMTESFVHRLVFNGTSLANLKMAMNKLNRVPDLMAVRCCLKTLEVCGNALTNIGPLTNIEGIYAAGMPICCWLWILLSSKWCDLDIINFWPALESMKKTMDVVGDCWNSSLLRQCCRWYSLYMLQYRAVLLFTGFWIVLSLCGLHSESLLVMKIALHNVVHSWTDQSILKISLLQEVLVILARSDKFEKHWGRLYNLKQS